MWFKVEKKNLRILDLVYLYVSYIQLSVLLPFELPLQNLMPVYSSSNPERISDSSIHSMKSDERIATSACLRDRTITLCGPLRAYFKINSLR